MSTSTSNYGFKKPDPNEYFSLNDINGNMDLIDKEIANVSSEYMFDVITSDANNKPTHATYKRYSDSTLYKDITCSNPDVNGYYQTVVEKTYAADGTTLVQTKTYTLTFNVDGIIQTKRRVIS